MFQQTFLDTSNGVRKPIALGISLLLEVAAVCLTILLSVIYSQTLPAAQLRALLVAPPPPAAHTQGPQNVMKAQVQNYVRHFGGIQAPVRVPTAVARNVVETPAPTVGVDYGSNVPASSQGLDGVIGSVIDGAPPPMRTQPASKSAAGPIHFATKVAEANLIRRVQPVYPKLAAETHVQGLVEFRAIISKEGNIQNLQLVRGHPLLVTAARDAILQWRYKPTLLNGQPVEVSTDILVNFTLMQ